ncbi:MAG: plasmid pRiA4b ORF-3 family protein [Actinomycetota bacterium]
MAKQVLQLKITLRGTRPPIWRRLLVNGDDSLLRLHEIFRSTFEWDDDHLHDFTINEVRYGTDLEDAFGRAVKSESQARLGQVVWAGSRFKYVYDFGEWWELDILVEKVLDPTPGAAYPACIGGRRLAPLEYSGPEGYPDLLDAIADPNHPHHESRLEWVKRELGLKDSDPGDVTARLQAEGLIRPL